MKQLGIWLDLNQANIIRIENGEVKTSQIDSNIEHFHPKGGSHSKSPWGPTDKISESKYLNRKDQQSNDYFEEITKEIENVDEVFIFGPAEAKLGLAKFVGKRKDLSDRVLAVQPADSMTINEKIAKVKTFYKPLK